METIVKGMLNSYDPSNGEHIGEVEVTSLEEMNAMITKAKEEQVKWHELGIDERIYILEQISDELNARSMEIGELLSREMGKSLSRGVGEVRSCASDIPYKGDEVKKALKPLIYENFGMKSVIEYNPLGVVGVITPWNYPMSMGHWFILPALLAGNTVIYKPSEETPLTAAAYAEVFNNHLPEGVLQMVYGDHVQGQALVESDVDMICFTGSQEVGKEIVRHSAGTLKRMIMELGGNDPLIVLEDADVDYAARFAVGNSLELSGQMCIATERIFVHESLADTFEEKVAAYTATYKVGPWTDQGADIGPIINEKQRQRILNQVEDAKAKGAKLIYGDENHPKHFVNPLVLTGITEEMDMFKEETFGPIICINRFSDADEAIELANDTTYGLGATVFGKKDVEYVAKHMEAGMVGINTGVGAIGDTPWIGAKQSGLGYHGSPDGHRQFTQPRVMSYGVR